MITRNTLLALTFAALPGSVLATDAFTVSVPVDFRSLNSAVTTVEIRCSLTARSAVSTTTTDAGHPKYARLPVTGGNYPGPSPITVVWTLEEFPEPERANLPWVNGGSCIFQLVTPTGTYVPYGGETSPILAQRPGSPFRERVSFTFPVP
jgi:hypothetical protein